MSLCFCVLSTVSHTRARTQKTRNNVPVSDLYPTKMASRTQAKTPRTSVGASLGTKLSYYGRSGTVRRSTRVRGGRGSHSNSPGATLCKILA
jgi:hypothetical protein